MIKEFIQNAIDKEITKHGGITKTAITKLVQLLAPGITTLVIDELTKHGEYAVGPKFRKNSRKPSVTLSRVQNTGNDQNPGTATELELLDGYGDSLTNFKALKTRLNRFDIKLRKKQ